MTAPTLFELPDVTIAVAEVGDVRLAYPLTPCCATSGKGSESPTGVVCRACYRPVDPIYGDCAPLYPVPGAWPTERIVQSWTGATEADVAALVQSWRDAGLVSA